MSFLIRCPNCGERDSDEFRYGGESRDCPADLSDDAVWADYVFGRNNHPGETSEWWFHRLGCRRWFVAERHLTTNQMLHSHWPPTPEATREGRPS